MKTLKEMFKVNCKKMLLIVFGKIYMLFGISGYYDSFFYHYQKVKESRDNIFKNYYK